MITSNNNAKVKQLITWQKKRKAREEDGIYIVEGLRMFVEVPEAKVREVYVSESFYKKRKEELNLDKWGRRLEVLSDSVYSHVSDTKTPQGIIAVIKHHYSYTSPPRASLHNMDYENPESKNGEMVIPIGI